MRSPLRWCGAVIEILVDDRAGSKEMVRYIKGSKLCRIPFGDVSFFGRGLDDRPISVGIEIKSLADILKCICDGRFAAHQLPGLLSSFEVVYLIVHGIYRPDYRTGELVVPRGRSWVPAQIGSRCFMYRELDAWLMSIELRTGVHVRRTGSAMETAFVIKDLAGWWSKDWEKHRSHLALHDPPDGELIRKPSLVRRVAAQLPGIGWKRSGAAAAHFGSVFCMIAADTGDWRNVDGVGKITAEKVVMSVMKGEER